MQKDVEQFCRNSRSFDGRYSQCRTCVANKVGVHAMSHVTEARHLHLRQCRERSAGFRVKPCPPFIAWPSQDALGASCVTCSVQPQGVCTVEGYESLGDSLPVPG